MGRFFMGIGILLMYGYTVHVIVFGGEWLRAPERRVALRPRRGRGWLGSFARSGRSVRGWGDQRLLGFDLGDDGLLRGEGGRGIWMVLISTRWRFVTVPDLDRAVA